MEIPRHWRLKEQRYNLVGTVCSQCGEKYFPPRQVCPQCGVEISQPCNFSGKGDVFTFTTIYEPPSGYEENAPYTVALVKLVEGPLVTAQMTDLGETEPEIGMPVEIVVRRIKQDGDERGMLVYGYKFRPVLKI